MLRWLSRVSVLLFSFQILVPAGCASRQVAVLHAPPRVAYSTLGMVSGQGENESAAMGHVLDQARNLEADAVIVTGRKMLGQSTILTCRAIRYLGPPPEAEPVEE